MRRVSQLLTSLKAALVPGKVGRPGRLRPADAFSAAIRLEQARVDRNEHAFSLVVFDAGHPERKAAATRLLVQSLSDRIRSTDEIGWFDDCRVGVLLPYTYRDGAAKFVDDINDLFGRTEFSVTHTIYSYPSHWPPDNGDGRPGQLHFSDICGKWDADEAGGAPGPTGHSIDAARSLEREASPEGIEPSKSGPLPAWKRTMDIVGSLCGLALATPFLLVHAVILKAVSPGPVFFRQKRIGYMGRPFTMWKLRTMDVSVDTSVHQEHVSQLINGANNRDYNKPMTKLDDDPYIIPGGLMLRKTCLDEVPQLINVLRGEMSLVGPRPPLEYEVDEFLDWQHRRFDAVPGMTGLWQVSGKNRLSFSQMIRLDIQYSRRKTLWLDLAILLKTPLAIVGQIKDNLVLRERQRLTMEGRHV